MSIVRHHVGIRGSVYAQQEGTGPHGAVVASVELDKSWHGIHFLISGSKDGGIAPQHFLLGEESSVDVGDAEVFHYGVARVREIDRFLRECTPQVLLDRFDGKQMRELNIYPECEWDQGDFDYLLSYYNELRAFVARQAAAGNELLVVLS